MQLSEKKKSGKIQVVFECNYLKYINRQIDNTNEFKNSGDVGDSLLSNAFAILLVIFVLFVLH